MVVDKFKGSYMRKVYGIYGASGYGREVMPILRQDLEFNRKENYELFFIDDFSQQKVINSCSVITYEKFLKIPESEKFISICISNSSVRESLSLKIINDGINFINIISKNSTVFDDVEIGEGAILNPYSTLTSNIRIGKHFQANLYSYIAHDCVVGNFVTLAPGAKVNGNVILEDHVYVGTGAIIKQGTTEKPITIGKGAVIGMGAVVTKSIPAGHVVVGNPARPLALKE